MAKVVHRGSLGHRRFHRGSLELTGSNYWTQNGLKRLSCFQKSHRGLVGVKRVERGLWDTKVFHKGLLGLTRTNGVIEAH